MSQILSRSGGTVRGRPVRRACSRSGRARDRRGTAPAGRCDRARRSRGHGFGRVHHNAPPPRSLAARGNLACRAIHCGARSRGVTVRWHTRSASCQCRRRRSLRVDRWRDYGVACLYPSVGGVISECWRSRAARSSRAGNVDRPTPDHRIALCWKRVDGDLSPRLAALSAVLLLLVVGDDGVGVSGRPTRFASSQRRNDSGPSQGDARGAALR